MKSLKLILLLVLSPLTFFAQQLSGLWIGALTNDSTSVRKDQSFEIILSQYKEKVYGYSRSTFMVNDTLYYIVKRVKGTINGDICEVKDDHVVSHNFPKKPEKGVKVISTFHRNKQDSSWYLAGDWKTTQTKKYYTVSGKVDLKGEKDLTASKLFPHLEELGLDKDIPFYVEAKKAEQDALAKKVAEEALAKTKANSNNNKDIAKVKPVTSPATVNNKPVSNKVLEEKKTEPVAKTVVPENKTNPAPAAVIEEKKTETAIKTGPRQSGAEPANYPVAKNTIADNAKTEPQKNNESGVKKNSAIVSAPAVEEKKPVNNPPVIAKNTPNQTIAAPEQKKPVTVQTPKEDLTNASKTATPKTPTPPANTATAATEVKKTEQPAETKKPVVADTKPDVSTTNTAAIPSPVKPATEPATAAVFVSARKTDAPQYVNYVSDSLVLILYDNGEVDGDTVSVLLNGEMFMAKQGLKTSAIRKTIYITPGNEELTLLLYAENLGKYPPNTGLLVVYDGEERYQLRFSADFQKNASVVFRRKK